MNANIEQEIEDFFKTHSTLEGWDLAHQLSAKYDMQFKDAFMMVSHYLSSQWGAK